MPRSLLNTILVTLTACALAACSKPAEAPKEEALANLLAPAKTE